MATTYTAKAPAHVPRIECLRCWQERMQQERGPHHTEDLLIALRHRYERLYATRPGLSDPALRWHLEQNILPGLALYRTLIEYADMQPEAAYRCTESYLACAARGQQRRIAIFGRLPWLFGLFRRGLRWIMARQFPASEWQITWVEDSPQCIGFDLHTCFYHSTLSAYGAPELTPAFCHVDDVNFIALSPAIRFERTKTLGRGDEVCDFRYYRAGGV